MKTSSMHVTQMADCCQYQPLRMQLVRCFGCCADLWNRPLSVWTPFTEDYQEKIAIDINAKLHRIGAKVAHAKACRDVFGSLWWSGAAIADVLCEFVFSGFCAPSDLRYLVVA